MQHFRSQRREAPCSGQSRSRTCCCIHQAGVSRWTGAQHYMSSLPGDGTDVSKFNMCDDRTETSSAQGRNVGARTPGRPGAHGEMTRRKPEDLHTHSGPREWEWDSGCRACSSRLSACCPSPPGNVAGRTLSVGLTVSFQMEGSKSGSSDRKALSDR